MKFDLYNEFSAVKTIEAAAFTADPQTDNTTGWVDLQGFQGALIVIDIGIITDGVFTTRLEDADVEAAAKTDVADVAAEFILGTQGAFVNTSDRVTSELGYIGSKRFLRVGFTVTGAPATGGLISAMIIRGRPQNTPVR